MNKSISGADLAASLDPRTQEFRQMVRLTPGTFATYRTGGKWVAAPHLLAIAAQLAVELTRSDARIIVEVPPRHGKSELISVHTPIWFLELFPWAQVILTTYAAELSVEFGRRVRDAFLVNEGGHLTTKVRDDAQKMSLFLSEEGGAMRSVGIGGPITGKGAHLLLVDDFLKNWEEATSLTKLDDIRNWFVSTAYTRLEPGGSCVVLATRWVVNDLIGWLKEKDKTGMWTVIRFPAIAEENDPLGRKVGEALWPDRYPLKTLQSIKSVLGDYIFSALYQQDPKEVSEVQAQVNNITIVHELPKNYRWCRSWDLASTDPEEIKKRRRNKSDYSVGALVGSNSIPGLALANCCIADMKRGQWKPEIVEEKIRETADIDGPNIPIIIEQEPGASGKSWAQHLKNNVLGGYDVEVVPAGTSNKWIRAQPYIAAVSSGRVSWVQADWNAIHRTELQVFPNGKHEDTVDAVALGFSRLHNNPIANQATWGRTESGILIPQTAISSYRNSPVWGRRS